VTGQLEAGTKARQDRDLALWAGWKESAYVSRWGDVRSSPFLIRRAYLDNFEAARRKNFIHGLLEMDVTEVRRSLRHLEADLVAGRLSLSPSGTQSLVRFRVRRTPAVPPQPPLPNAHATPSMNPKSYQLPLFCTS
jgi:hypothetical protein